MNSFNQMQIMAVEWAVRCFGMAHVMDRRVRSLRLVEEAIEYAQSVGTDPEMIHRLTDMVYARPPGEPVQELGGVMLTAAVAADSLGVMAHEVMFRELRRVLAKSPEHFAKRNLEKIGMGVI
jgi:hypothetical protein